MTLRTRWRYLVNNVMLSLTGVAAVLTISVLFFILGYLVANGWKSVDLAFFTQLPKPPGEDGGGMGNAILGSATMIALASLIGVPIGFFAGIYLAEYEGGW